MQEDCPGLNLREAEIFFSSSPAPSWGAQILISTLLSLIIFFHRRIKNYLLRRIVLHWPLALHITILYPIPYNTILYHMCVYYYLLFCFCQKRWILKSKFLLFIISTQLNSTWHNSTIRLYSQKSDQAKLGLSKQNKPLQLGRLDRRTLVELV